MILTGRPVSAHEALQMGLANRVVPVGEALTVAHRLAEEIAAFPQACMRADRASAIGQWDLPLDEALRAEGVGGLDALLAEGVSGAERFASGEGRHGAF
jgi:enoyl-CoA hydratase